MQKIGQELTQAPGQPIVIENKGGAGYTPAASDTFIRAEAQNWGEVARAAKISPECASG